LREPLRLLKERNPKFVTGIAVDDGQDRLALAAALITMFEKATKSLMTAQEGERRAYGYDYKQQQAPQAEDGVKQRAERADAVERRYGHEL
jgi:hypothetical protein